MAAAEDEPKVISHQAMKIELTERPKSNPIIIEGFPGYGFVATIAIEYLMDHLNTRSIGKIWSPDLAPIALVHNKRIIQPLEIFYNDKFNIILLEAVSGVGGMEWEIADAIMFLYKELKAKEIISIEGIGSQAEQAEPSAYYYTNQPDKKLLLERIGCKALVEGMIFGVSGALLQKVDKAAKASFIFAETHSNLPDSRAAAKIVEVLDKYINLKIDPKPLLKRAAEFEDRLKDMLQKTKEATAMQKEKEMPTEYIG